MAECTISLREGLIETIHGVVSEDAIVAFFWQDSSTTMVYVRDEQYNIKMGLGELLECLGGDEVFAKIGDGLRMCSPVIFVRRAAVEAVSISNRSHDGVMVHLRNREAPLRYKQVPIEKFYEQLGWTA